MKKNRNSYFIILLISILLMIALSACGQETENNSDLISDESENSLNIPDVEDSSEEDLEQDQEQAVIVEVVSACVECHSDKQQLIDTAKPEEEKESENEGVG